MKLTAAIDAYIEDMRLEGRINSPATERDYRGALMAHAEDVANRDPRYTNRDDVKRTLSRWAHPNSRGKQRSIFVSFYDWLVEEGLRPHNPARQTRRTKRRASAVYRLTSEETRRWPCWAQPAVDASAAQFGSGYVPGSETLSFGAFRAGTSSVRASSGCPPI